jgi:hypothetical protein
VELGIITGYEITTNKDSTTDSLLLQVEMLDGDVRIVELISQAGEDTNPADGCRVCVIDASKGYKVGIAVTDNLTPEVDPGEKEFYSTDSPATTKKARLKLGADGLITIQNEVEVLATLLADFIDEIKAIQTIGSPANHTISPASQALLEAIKTRLNTLFGS